jgi:tetratricopeptide (TPR) repeat protein
MTRTFASFSAVLLATALSTGCAARRSGRSFQRFVERGEPATGRREPATEAREPATEAREPATEAREPANDKRDPASPAPDSMEQYVAKIRNLSARARPAPQIVPTLESWDRKLAAALLLAAAAPSAESLRNVGDEYRRLGVLDVAFRYYNGALRADPADAAAYDGLARIWRDWGLPGLALGDASRAVYYARSSGAAHNTLGTVMQALGNRREARAAYEQARRSDPHASYALTNLCYLSFLEGKTDAALGECRQAITLDPDARPAHNNLALIYASQGRLDLARLELSRDGDEAASQFNMGVIYMATKDYGRAATAFQAALVARPSFFAAGQRARQAKALAQ